MESRFCHRNHTPARRDRYARPPHRSLTRTHPTQSSPHSSARSPSPTTTNSPTPQAPQTSRVGQVPARRRHRHPQAHSTTARGQASPRTTTRRTSATTHRPRQRPGRTAVQSRRRIARRTSGRTADMARAPRLRTRSRTLTSPGSLPRGGSRVSSFDRQCGLL